MVIHNLIKTKMININEASHNKDEISLNPDSLDLESIIKCNNCHNSLGT
jgi:hypothetical protein